MIPRYQVLRVVPKARTQCRGGTSYVKTQATDFAETSSGATHSSSLLGGAHKYTRRDVHSSKNWVTESPSRGTSSSLIGGAHVYTRIDVTIPNKFQESPHGHAHLPLGPLAIPDTLSYERPIPHPNIAANASHSTASMYPKETSNANLVLTSKI